MLINRITKQRFSAIKEHKYTSDVYSIVDECYLKYITRFVLTLTPRSISPNAITVSNFIASSFLSLLYIIFHLQMFIIHSVPLYIVNNIMKAALIIYCQIYLILDSLDGLQARRINCSTITGEILDHALDAFSSLWFSMISYLSFESTFPALSVPLLILLKLEFLRVHIEAYYCNVFRENIMGSTEGLTIYSVNLLLSFFITKDKPMMFKGYKIFTEIVVAGLGTIRAFEICKLYFNNWVNSRTDTEQEKKASVRFVGIYMVLTYSVMLYKWVSEGMEMTTPMTLLVIQETPIYFIVVVNLILMKSAQRTNCDLFKNSGLLVFGMLNFFTTTLFMKNTKLSVIFIVLNWVYAYVQFKTYILDILTHENRRLFQIK
eukprot:GAHX01000954.1.p1 GENE.GAHX01000954.1~~GAHX01000954.1.p1  ORF type:complete len:375 (-),score=41.80 GAHX01000954.1:99-1223(-)